ncbi:MAG: hypothetical protein A2Y79_01010 [Deltaproteobacteria bacterium RBG_13_43_22]|nr:MAG: hypothetical protein A2Y79_01010 [Deltaproteobacteria bacterium RBG_13_43_22]
MKSPALIGAGWPSFQDCHPIMPKLFSRVIMNLLQDQADAKARNRLRCLPCASKKISLWAGAGAKGNLVDNL